MRVEKLSSNKLKITLTDDDLSELDIDLEDLYYDAEQASDFFWSLLNDIDDNLNFFNDGCRLVIEAVQSSDDAFIMIITKIDEEEGAAPHKYAKAKVKQKPQCVIYSFDNIKNAVDGCKRISVYFAGNSRFYKFCDKYFLVSNGINRFISKDSDILLSDYGYRVPEGQEFEGVLAEKGEFLIKEDAVEILCSYF